MGLNGISRVHILGGAQTDFARNWSREGKGAVALLREVLDDGLTAAGVTDEDIRALNGAGRVACFVGNFCAEQYVRQGHLGALLTEASPLFYGVPAARYEAACASGSVALDAAMTKIRAGDADLCIVIGWELMKTVDSAVCGDILGFAALQEEESEGVPYPFPRLFGRLADELVRRYRLPEEIFLDDLARIAAGNYAAARSNPLAQTRKWFMDYGEARHRRKRLCERASGGFRLLADHGRRRAGCAGVRCVRGVAPPVCAGVCQGVRAPHGASAL